MIRAWAEARGARPARVKGSEVLRLAFDRPPTNWELISWEQFFEIFDRSGQSFWHDDSPESRIFKLTRESQHGPIRLI